MLITTQILLILPILTLAYPTDIEVSIDPVEANNENIDLTRSKRAGSFDFVGHIKNSIASSIGKASASSAGSSSGKLSSGSGSGGSGHHDEHHEEEAKFDGWQLKKSILNTLFQAVKAITGGITAINGKLIKGSGYAISAGGQLVAASGEKVANVGKNIALSAKLIPPSSHGHFSKLAGASSSLSSHSSGGGHDSSGHSESFTSYDHPIDLHSGYGHSGGAGGGIGGGHIGHGGGGGGQLYLPAPYDSSYHGSENHEQSYPAQHSSYGTSSVDHSNYINNEHTAKNKEFEFTGQSDTFKLPSKSESLQNAANAIRNLLKKIPEKNLHNDEIKEQNYGHQQYNSVKQYDIPTDPYPVPQFQPMKPAPAIHPPPSGAAGPVQQQYGAPVNSITHSQTITTAYGAPFSNFQKPIALIDANNLINGPVGPSAASDYNQNSEPLDLYHTMTLKYTSNNNVNNNNIPPTSDYSPPDIQYVNPINPNHLQFNENQLHQQHLQKLQYSIGNDYEVHKSLGYEIQLPDPRHANHRRRFTVVKKMT